jgi:hypothetical protein
MSAYGWSAMDTIQTSCPECKGVGYAHNGRTDILDTPTDKISFWTCCEAFDDSFTISSMETYGCIKCSKGCKDNRKVLVDADAKHWDDFSKRHQN